MNTATDGARPTISMPTTPTAIEPSSHVLRLPNREVDRSDRCPMSGPANMPIKADTVSANE